MFNIPFNKSTDTLPKDNQNIILLKVLNSFDSFGVDFVQTKVSFNWENINEDDDDYLNQYSLDEDPDYDFQNDPNFKLVLLDDNGFEFEDLFYWIDIDEFYQLTANALDI
jgi:hypothetical protein